MQKPAPRNWPLLTVLLLNAVLLAGLVFTFSRMAAAVSERNSHPGVYALLQIGPLPQGHVADPQEVPVGLGQLRMFGRTQQALLKSRLVLIRTLRNPAIAALPIVQKQKDAVTWLEGQLRTEFPDSPTTLRVSIDTGTPKEQVILINAVVAAFLQECDNLDRRAKQRQLDRRLKCSMHFAEQKWNTLRMIEQALSFAGTLASGKEGALRQLKQLQAEFLQVQSQMRKAQVELERLQQAKRGDLIPAEVAIERAMQDERILAGLLDRAAGLADCKGMKKFTAIRGRMLRRAALDWLREVVRAEQGAARERLEQKVQALEAEAAAFGDAAQDPQVARRVAAAKQGAQRAAPLLRVTLLAEAVAAP